MRIKKWLKRIGLSILFLIALALITGVIYEQIGRHQAKKHKESRAGNLVDVGGHKLYYEKKGEGDVTVVFESGAPGDHRAWGILSDTISKYATTITYDRAGLLWSERGANAKTAVNVSADLENLLTKAGAPKPYVLVGHSAASIYFRPFISEYQNDIQGVVLIDPSHPNQISRAPEEIKEAITPPFFPPKWVVFFANEIGLPRLFAKDPLFYRSLKSGGAYDEVDYLMYRMEHDIPKLPSKTWSTPLVVISAGKFDFSQFKTEEQKIIMRDYWSSLQIETSQLSSQGERIVAEESGHNMLYSERELITNEILNMVHLQDSISTK